MRLPFESTIRRIRVQAIDRREARDEAQGVLPARLNRGRERAWALTHSALFDAVPAECVETLANAARRRVLEPRAELLLDDESSVVFLVESGGVKLVRITMDGRQLIQAVIDPGGFFGALSAGDDDDSLMVESLEASSLLEVRRGALTQLMRDQPDFALSIVQNLDQQRRRLSRRVASLVFKNVEQRVVEAIVEMCHHYADRCEHGMAVDIRLSQQDLAGLVGTTRESVSRVLSEMEKRKYLRKEGRVLCIPSIGRLERLGRAHA